MSDLKNIVIFILCLQVAFIVVNELEIAPGVKLSSSGINPVLDYYSPATDILTSINSTYQAFNPTIDSAGSQTTTFHIDRILFIDPNISWSVTMVGADIWGALFLFVSALVMLIIAIITLIFSCLGLIMLLLFMATAGAIPFYISLFSLIDPVFGAVLGGALGLIQLVYVIWGLTEFIPTVPMKEA